MIVPVVSFVIPVYNGTRYLRECLRSALEQTLPPAEIIVIDDGSTDGPERITNELGPVVRCERQRHVGQAAARNHGLSLARGDFIAFLDADDIAHPTRLEKQLGCFSANPALQFCDAYTRNFWTPEIPESDRQSHPRERFTHGEAPKPGMIITWLLRRSLFAELGPFDTTLHLGEDTEWRDRLERRYIARQTLPEILASRRLHHDNLTRRNYDEYLRGIVRHSKQRMESARAAHDSE